MLRPKSKVTVEVPSKLWDEFRARADQREVTASEFLRRALWVHLELDQRVNERGYEIILHPPNPGESEYRLLLAP